MTLNASKLKEHVAAALAQVAKLEDAGKLKRLHANIQRHAALEESDREILNEAVMMRLRTVSPAIATQLGGPKDAQAREFLEGFFEQLAAEFDLSKNHLKNGVKTGGYMINGSKYIDVYISYKTETGKNLSLAWIQNEPESPSYFHLMLRQVGTGASGELVNQKLHDETEAKDAYAQQLRKLLKIEARKNAT